MASQSKGKGRRPRSLVRAAQRSAAAVAAAAAAPPVGARTRPTVARRRQPTGGRFDDGGSPASQPAGGFSSVRGSHSISCGCPTSACRCTSSCGGPWSTTRRPRQRARPSSRRPRRRPRSAARPRTRRGWRAPRGSRATRPSCRRRAPRSSRRRARRRQTSWRPVWFEYGRRFRVSSFSFEAGGMPERKTGGGRM